MSTWQAISAFRLVTQQLETLSAFYASIGFRLETRQQISSEEMQLLGLQRGGLRAHMKLGNTVLDLDQYERAGSPYPASVAGTDTRFQHLAIVTPDIDTAWSRVLASGGRPISEQGPVKLPETSGGVTAVKFRDPEGHPLELLQFPDVRKHNELFERIDHSAISVSSVAASIGFYQPMGLKVGAQTLNSGFTQSALDDVKEACVDVIPMEPSESSPHLELLHYRVSTSSTTEVTSVNDVCATRIVWHSDRDALVRDPDGHHHQLLQSRS